MKRNSIVFGLLFSVVALGIVAFVVKKSPTPAPGIEPAPEEPQQNEIQLAPGEEILDVAMPSPPRYPMASKIKEWEVGDDVERGAVISFDVAADKDGNVYVTDGELRSVFKYDSDGTFLKKFQGPHGTSSALAAPSALAVGGDGSLYVLDERKGDIKYSYADISKAKTLLRFNPKVNLKDGLQGLIESTSK